MSSATLSQPFRRLWALEKFSYSLRVFIALASTMLLCWSINQLELIIPLFLGITASALSETDDNWIGRLKALWVTLICFGIAAISVEWLFPYPWLFALGLAGSAFALVMLGALGERYATIASATLILSIYSMITVDQRGGETLHYWHEPLLLMSGAAWYGALSVLWSALFVHQPVEQSLARIYRELARYFRMKAALFEPQSHLDIEACRLELAHQSSQVVAAMNAAKEVLLHRMPQAHSDQAISRYLHLYFLAQDLHERVTSSHYPYHELTQAFFHSDVLFRCQYLLKLQAKACLNLADTILMQQSFHYGTIHAQARNDLQASLSYLQQQADSKQRPLLGSLQALANNLAQVQDKLAHVNEPQPIESETDSTLFNNQPQSLNQAFTQLRGQFTLTSLLFRHALRMTIALVCGYIVLHAIHPEQGYWILLTTVFVCQPNYGATRIRLMQRITGTLMGLVAGWIVFSLFPAPATQAIFAVIAGVVFFIARSTHYTLATAAITLLVLLCFNQVGNGYDLIIPRLFDTLLGCAIAASAVFWIFPDWQGRRLNQIAAQALNCNAIYLRQIMKQYHTGKRDDLAYRVARRNAHNAESALSTTVSSMMLEPEPFRKEAETGLHFLTLSHTLLNYLSALGAHRETEPTTVHSAVTDEISQNLAHRLEEIAQLLQQQKTDLLQIHQISTVQPSPDNTNDQQQLLYNQLGLINQQVEGIYIAAQKILNPVGTLK